MENGSTVAPEVQNSIDSRIFDNCNVTRKKVKNNLL